MTELARYPELESKFISNNNIWKVVKVEKNTGKICLECKKHDDVDKIEIDFTAYLFLLQFGFMYKEPSKKGTQKHS